MGIEIQKSLLLEKLKNNTVLTADLKEKFEKQIEKMNDEEFVVFAESIMGIKDEQDLKEKIVKTREIQTKEHKNFLQSASDFLGKIIRNELKEQTGEDNLKIASLLKKIKSL